MSTDLESVHYDQSTSEEMGWQERGLTLAKAR